MKINTPQPYNPTPPRSQYLLFPPRISLARSLQIRFLISQSPQNPSSDRPPLLHRLLSPTRHPHFPLSLLRLPLLSHPRLRPPPLSPHSGPLSLDARGLTLLSVLDPFSLYSSPPHPIKGCHVTLTLDNHSSFLIVYTTSAAASALQWLQEGADRRGRLSAALRRRRVVEEFLMEQPIPPYLFSFAVGELGFKEVGRRTSVCGGGAGGCGKGVLEHGGHDQARGGVVREYEWERFDLLVLPPSFPYGGMENPRMTVFDADGIERRLERRTGGSPRACA